MVRKIRINEAEDRPSRLTSEEQDYIRSLFNDCNVDIIDEWFDYLEYEGIEFPAFNIATDNLNTGKDMLNLDRLMDRLYTLEDKNIGFEKLSGDNGFYSYNFEFYHYF